MSRPSRNAASIQAGLALAASSRISRKLSVVSRIQAATIATVTVTTVRALNLVSWMGWISTSVSGRWLARLVRTSRITDLSLRASTCVSGGRATVCSSAANETRCSRPSACPAIAHARSAPTRTANSMSIWIWSIRRDSVEEAMSPCSQPLMNTVPASSPSPTISTVSADRLRCDSPAVCARSSCSQASVMTASVIRSTL